MQENTEVRNVIESERGPRKKTDVGRKRAMFNLHEIKLRLKRENDFVVNAAKIFENVLKSVAQKYRDLNIIVFDSSPRRSMYNTQNIVEALQRGVDAGVLASFEGTNPSEFTLKIKRYATMKELAARSTTTDEIPCLTLSELLAQPRITECDASTERLINGMVYKCVSAIVESSEG